MKHSALAFGFIVFALALVLLTSTTGSLASNAAFINAIPTSSPVPSAPVLECAYPQPADSYVYNVPLGAPTFYAADPATKLGWDLPAGTWRIGNFSDDFAQVWISCGAVPVYIPADAVLR